MWQNIGMVVSNVEIEALLELKMDKLKKLWEEERLRKRVGFPRISNLTHHEQLVKSLEEDMRIMREDCHTYEVTKALLKKIEKESVVYT
jgi:hypothetical protein